MQRIRKRYFITLGTSLINSTMSLPSLAKPLFLELFIYLMNTIKCFYFFKKSRERTILKIYFIHYFVNKIYTFYVIFRKPVFMLTLVQTLVGGFAMLYAPDLVLYNILQFIAAMGQVKKSIVWKFIIKFVLEMLYSF